MIWRYIRNVATLQYDAERCIGCGRCVEVCPHAVFAMDGKRARIVHRDACMECGACAKNCPAMAVLVDAGVGCAAAVLIGAFNPSPTFPWLSSSTLRRIPASCMGRSCCRRGRFCSRLHPAVALRPRGGAMYDSTMTAQELLIDEIRHQPEPDRRPTSSSAIDRPPCRTWPTSLDVPGGVS